MTKTVWKLYRRHLISRSSSPYAPSLGTRINRAFCTSFLTVSDKSNATWTALRNSATSLSPAVVKLVSSQSGKPIRTVETKPFKRANRLARSFGSTCRRSILRSMEGVTSCIFNLLRLVSKASTFSCLQGGSELNWSTKARSLLATKVVSGSSNSMSNWASRCTSSAVSRWAFRAIEFARYAMYARTSVEASEIKSAAMATNNPANPAIALQASHHTVHWLPRRTHCVTPLTQSSSIHLPPRDVGILP